jgi:hypothetical protein
MAEGDELTDAELDVLRRSAPRKCPTCKRKGSFVPGGNLYAFGAVNRTGYDVPMRFPVALLVCKDCSHVVLRSAVALGLMSEAVIALAPKPDR